MSFLEVHPNPSKPKFKLPANACDSHCHVFGPADRFPYSPARKYTPVDAPREKLFALHQHLGFDRSVLVQASCHGTDNSAMVDVLDAGAGRYRGVAVVAEDISDTELAGLHAAGVRGIRFNFVKRLVDIKPFSYYRSMADRISELGWHIIAYFESEELAGLEELLFSLPVPLVIDHMGRPKVGNGLQDRDFQRICSFMQNREESWIKVGCHERLTDGHPPDYPDVVPFARHLVENFPDQVLWGTDWPHPNMQSHMPDDGVLVDNIPLFACTENLQHKLLVENPQRLYQFEAED